MLNKTLTMIRVEGLLKFFKNFNKKLNKKMSSNKKYLN